MYHPRSLIRSALLIGTVIPCAFSFHLDLPAPDPQAVGAMKTEPRFRFHRPNSLWVCAEAPRRRLDTGTRVLQAKVRLDGQATRPPPPPPKKEAPPRAERWTVKDAIRVPWRDRADAQEDSAGDEAGNPAFVVPANGKGRAGVPLDINRLTIRWKAGERGSQVQKGGFGYVYFGSYDASDIAGPAYSDVKVVVKLPTQDEDAINAFEREGLLNARIASFGGITGVAEFIGSVDLTGVDASLLPAGVGGRTGLVWRTVPGKTLDTYFDRRGGMSPMLAKTLDVRASAPVQLPSGELSYIKVDLAVKAMSASLQILAELHDLDIIHRDFKPQNLMLVENMQQAPLRAIDLGSAVLRGQEPLMEDFTEIYAPPEAPYPERQHPHSYDIYSVGIIGLRCMMPALLAGEAGVQTLGAVTCAELPKYDYDFRAWCEGRASNKASMAKDIPLNTECLALMQLPDLFNLIDDMLAKDPSKRPSAHECLQRLQRPEEDSLSDGCAHASKRFPVGLEIPLLWREGQEWSYAEGGADKLAAGSPCVVKRSDGKLKFGEIKREGGQGKYDVIVEPSGAFQKDLPGNSIGVLHLGSSLPG